LDLLREFASDCAGEDVRKEVSMELEMERLGSLIALIVPSDAQVLRMEEVERVVISRRSMNADGAADNEEPGAG